MSGSQVVDMHRWRARARVLRSAAPSATSTSAVDPHRPGAGGDGEVAAAATVLPLPDAWGRRQAGPPSVFGPVMAFGLLPRTQAGEAAAAAGAGAAGPVAAVAVGAGDEDAPVRTSFGRAPRARHLLDVRGAARGPRR